MYVGFGAVLVVLLGLLSFASLSFGRLATASNLNDHSYEVLDEVQQLLAAIIDVQAGYRGYILTGDADFLEPFLRGEPASAMHLQRLLAMTPDDADQQARLRRLEVVREQWMVEFIHPRLRIREEMDGETVTVESLSRAIDASAGNAFAETMRELIGEVRNVELALLRERTATVGRLRTITQATFLIGGLFAILITALLASMAARRSASMLQANRRLQREASVRERAEAAVRSLSRRNELILSTAADGIWGIDAQGITTFVNPAAAEMTGFSAEELVGSAAHGLIHHSHQDGRPYPEGRCPISLAAREGVPATVANEVFWRKDGSSFPVEYVASPISEDSDVTGAVIIFRDVTERREVERMKDEFVSVVSHELRTPLTSIRGSLGLLSSGLLGELPERGQRLLEIATQNTDRLVRLVNDILDIERIESGRR
jgi:PAS domain S-box-containing protein